MTDEKKNPQPLAVPQPAKTWKDATDSQGRLIDETVPRNRVFDEETFGRWRLCLGLAGRITQDPESAPTTRSLAYAFFDSDAETGPGVPGI